VKAARLLLLALALGSVPAPAFEAKPGAPAPVRELHAAQGTVEILFSPWDDTEGAILRVLHGARRAIYVQAFLFSSRPLARALIEAHARGVAVEVLADAEQAGRAEHSQLPALAAAGIPVALETRYAAAHNKIMIVDPGEPGGTVVTGSYNFTFSARAKNAENVVILRGNGGVARAYRENWRRHRLDAEPYAGVMKQQAN